MESKHIPEERVPAILARAAELDRQTITVDALRAAALEAGISSDALEQALAEYDAGSTPMRVMADVVAEKPRPKWRQWLKRVMEPLKLGTIALVVGLIGAADVELATVAVCWLIGTAGYLAWRDRGVGTPGRFQIAVTTMTIMMFLGMLGLEGDEDALGFVAGFGIALFVLGTLVVNYVGRGEETEVITTR